GLPNTYPDGIVGRSEDLQVDVLPRVGLEVDQELVELDRRLVEVGRRLGHVLVERLVRAELAEGAFALVDAAEARLERLRRAVEGGHRAVEALGERVEALRHALELGAGRHLLEALGRALEARRQRAELAALLLQDGLQALERVTRARRAALHVEHHL